MRQETAKSYATLIYKNKQSKFCALWTLVSSN